MSLSNEWFEYHLTPSGWVEGSEKIDFAGLKEKKLPSDRVLTLRFHEELSSAYSSPDRWYKEYWQHDDDKTINELISKFGNVPDQFQNSNYDKR